MTKSLTEKYSRISDSKFVTLRMMSDVMGKDMVVRMAHYKKHSRSKRLHAMINEFLTEWHATYSKPKLEIIVNDEFIFSRPSLAKLSLVG